MTLCVCVCVCVCVRVCVRACVHAMACMCKLKDNFALTLRFSTAVDFSPRDLV